MQFYKIRPIVFFLLHLAEMIRVCVIYILLIAFSHQID